jgi:four helix bundle protein
VWQHGISLARECYLLAKDITASEHYELGSQLRDASASVTANIAEGKGRRTKGEYAQFLGIARGSAREIDSHIELSIALGFLSAKESQGAIQLAEEVSRMLTAMMRKLAPL